MNNYILINRCFSEITPESAEHGDFSANGFITRDERITFTELVDLMQEHYNCSSYPNDYGINNWYSSGFYTSDYITGTEREETIHYSDNNTNNAAKYWKLARIAAELRIKRRSVSFD